MTRIAIMILLFLGTLSCQKTPKEELLATLNDITKNDKTQFYAVVLSNSDCATCVNELRKKIVIMNGKKSRTFYGIYFSTHSLDSSSLSIKAMMNDKNLSLKWHNSSALSLMQLLYKTSGEARGPYIVRVDGNTISATTTF